MRTSTSPSTASSSITVLFIDDNARDLQFWSSGLKSCSHEYTILEASTVQRGLALCRNEKVDCVVLDLDMPDSGFKALFELISDRKRPEKAVVILSRLPYPSLREMTFEHGAQAYLVKRDTSPDDLSKTIQKAVATVSTLGGIDDLKDDSPKQAP